MMRAVVTTIYSPTAAVKALAARAPAIVIGDRKTPADWQCDGAEFYSFDQQRKLGFDLLRYTRQNHYARKNIGYLLAMRDRATVIYDTDDDNVPNAAWQERVVDCQASTVSGSGWLNVYRFFRQSGLWPRGFPLTEITNWHPKVEPNRSPAQVRCSIQQGLADGDPDVDAICRLTVPSAREVVFHEHGSIALSKGVWCPFNSQSTWWFPEAFPLLYLPIAAPFRMTDIWRSFVAQRCLWEIGGHVAFHSPAEVVQERNPHDLLGDFTDEVSGYLRNGEIAELLGRLTLESGSNNVGRNLATCYQTLVYANVLPPSELLAVEAWLADVNFLIGK